MKTTQIGIVGCGNISGAYLAARDKFEILDIAACADLDPQRTRAKADEFNVPRACSVDELLADPDIEIVVNLTTPDAHAEVGLAALEAGKCVHNEKPLAVTRQDGLRLVDAARAGGLRLGCAPDTFLGAGIQTCRELIDAGAIGEPVAATAFMTCHGHESWHPAPEFYYRPGGGPMFDMGPYYLTALVALIGPIRRVTGFDRITFPERTMTSEARAGETVAVEVPTHVAGVLDFANGAIGTIITSFDVWAAHLPRIEIHGSDGSLSVPDPNGFGGPVSLWRTDEPEWREVPITRPYAEQSRGIGVADIACALRSGRPHRANGDLAYHVLDVMHAVHDASQSGRHIEMESTCDRPQPLPPGLVEGSIDP